MTYSNLGQNPSTQEMLDVCVRFLVAQGRPAVNMDGGCLYRSHSGYRCALGTLIPDELYVPEMEGKDIADLLKGHPELPEWMSSNQAFLAEIQNAHDMATGREANPAHNKVSVDYTESECSFWLAEFKIRILRICKTHEMRVPAELL